VELEFAEHKAAVSEAQLADVERRQVIDEAQQPARPDGAPTGIGERLAELEATPPRR